MLVGFFLNAHPPAPPDFVLHHVALKLCFFSLTFAGAPKFVFFRTPFCTFCPEITLQIRGSQRFVENGLPDWPPYSYPTDPMVRLNMFSPE